MFIFFFKRRRKEVFFFFFSSRRRHTRSLRDWSSDVCSSDLVMLLDEPTEGLAPVVVQSIASLLRTLKSRGVSILLAEQNHQVALRVADRAAFIEKGRIVEVLPADQARGSEVVHRILGV